MSQNAVTRGAHHVGLTVPDLGRTRAFFLDTLGFTLVGEIPDYPAVLLTDGVTMITLWQAENPAAAISFDRRNVIGLHHLAFNVADSDTLDALHAKLKVSEGVSIEFAPEPLGTGPAKHMMCAIPSGIRIEFIAAGG